MNALEVAAMLAHNGDGEAADVIRKLYDLQQETERKMRDLNRELYIERQTNIYLRKELGEWK